MSTPVSNTDCTYKTGNREIVIFLKVNQISPTGFEQIGRRKLFKYDRNEIVEKGLDKVWQSGEPISVDIHDVFRAESWFNAMVHDEF